MERDDGEGTTIREMKGAPGGAKPFELDLVVVSEYLSLIAALTRNGSVYFWDYCTFRLIGACKQRMFDVADLRFLEPFRILMSVHHTGALVLWDIAATQGSCFVRFGAAGSLNVCAGFTPTSVATFPSELEREDTEVAIVYFGSDEGVLAEVRLTKQVLQKYVTDIKPAKDARRRAGYFAARALKTELPPAEDVDMEELNVATIRVCSVEKEGKGAKRGDELFFKTQAHNESINMLKTTAMNERCLVVTKGDSQTLKFWYVEETSFELEAAINVEGAVPFVWNIDPQCEAARYRRLLRAAACLHQLDVKTGGSSFSSLVNSECMSQTFKTEVQETEKIPKPRPLLYGQLVGSPQQQTRKSGENIYDMLSFRQLDIRKSKLEDQQESPTEPRPAQSKKSEDLAKRLEVRHPVHAVGSKKVLHDKRKESRMWERCCRGRRRNAGPS